MAERTVVKMKRNSSKEAIKDKNMNKEEEKENIFLEHLKYCLSVSSFHGMNQIVWPNRSIFERLFWIGCVIGLTVFGMLKGYEVYSHYQYRPSMIGIEMDYWNWESEFPCLTVCQRELDENYLRSQNMTSYDEIYEYLNDLAFGTYASYYKYEKYANGSKKEYLQPEEYLGVLLKAVPFLTKDGPKYTKHPTDVKRPIFRLITEIGICVVHNPNAAIYYTPEYFNSSAPYKYDPLNINFKSKFVRIDLRGITTDSVYSVVSNDEVLTTGSKLLEMINGFLTTTNIYTTPIVTPDQVASLTYQQRNCKLPHETEGMLHSPIYSHSLCQIECRIKLCLKYCNCTPYYYRRLEGEKICNMTGMYCLSKYARVIMELDDDDGENLCFCYQNCNSTIVTVQSHAADKWQEGIRLQVEMERLPRMRYIRKLVFTKLDLIVQIGGILGLCLGCSILSIIEVIYFMTLRFYWGVFKGRAIKSSLNGSVVSVLFSGSNVPEVRSDSMQVIEGVKIWARSKKSFKDVLKGNYTH